MVARLIEGWESSTAVADYAGKWTTLAGALSIGAASGRNGNGLRQSGSAQPTIQKVLDAQATWVVGFAYRAPTILAANVTLCYFLDGAVLHCGLAYQTTTGLLYAWRGSAATGIGTSAFALNPGIWYYVEVRATIDDAAGVFEARVNGATVLNLTGADTRNAGTASANAVRLGHTGTVTGCVEDFDDVYVFDTTGSANTAFAGDCKVEQVLPSGAGAASAWTPSAGATWQCVDEAPPNGDTDYVSSATAGQTDTYACGDLAVAPSGTVKCVQATVLARKDDAGSRSLALVARPGGTDRVGSTQALADSYARYAQVWDTNPDTAAAWTVAETNASQFGQRLIA